jgi:hypothetical protein
MVLLVNVAFVEKRLVLVLFVVDPLFCACYEVPKATFWSKPGWFNKKRQIMNEEGVRYPRFSNHFQVGEEEDVVVRGGEAVEAREINEGGEGDEFVGDGKMCGC